MFSFIAESLLECFKDIALDVVGVVLALAFFVLSQAVSHLLVQPLFLHVQIALHRIVLLLALVVLNLDFTELVSQGSQTLDLGRQLLLLLFNLSVDPLDQSVQLLQRLRLYIVQLFFHFRDAHDLVFHLGISLHSLLFFEISQEIINIASFFFQNCLSPVQHIDFGFNFIKCLLHLFELIVLHSQISSVLPEVIPFHVLLSHLLLVCFFFLSQLLLPCYLLHLQFLQFFSFLLFLLAYTVRLRLIHRKIVICRRILL